MECVYWSFFLLQVISTFSPLVSSRPNTHNLSTAKVHHNAHSADFLRAVRSRIFGLRKLTMRSADPLSSSYSNLGMRLGRSVNEEQLFDNNGPEVDNVGHDQVKSTNTDNKDNIVCIYPREDDADHLLCMSPRNITSQFYAKAEPPSADEDAISKPSRTDVYLRSIRAAEQGDYRVRKSKGGNFLRFGKAITFNRFDRGRDNFMRYGRSDMKRSSTGNFIRFGRAFQDIGYDGSLRRGDWFVRYGRPLSVMGARQEPSVLSNHEVETTDDVDDEWIEKNKRNQNFLRLGRSEKVECADDDEGCIDEKNARRFKRSSADDCKRTKTCPDDSFLSKEAKDSTIELTHSKLKLRPDENKSSYGCKKAGDGSAGNKCGEVHSKWTDDIPTSSLLPTDENL